MNSSFGGQQQKRPTPKIYNDSILEALRDLSGGVGKTVAKDVAAKVATDTLTSLFGAMPKSGELKPNQPIEFAPEKAPQPAPAVRRPEMLRPRPVRTEDVQIKQQLEAVRAELKALSATLKQFNQEVQKAVAEVPVAPGVYHVNFFERLRSIILILREQIEDSRSWLAMWNTHKKKKNYWGMYKKHGTQFGLSSERTTATQAG